MTEAQKKSVALRSFELDWLRTAAVLVLVFFHTSEIFSDGWFHIKNGETSYFFNVLSSFIYIWHMPLFFFISGASSVYSLRIRTGRQYRKERIVRLLIPLIFGIVLIIPPQSYFENLQKANFSGSFLEYYPHFFDGIYPSGNMHWGHLWFLFYLFVFSIVISVSFFVVQYPLSIWIKYLIISLSAIPLIYACCELAKSNSVTRFIFGIK